MDVLTRLGDLKLPWGRTFVTFDEANVGMGHKEFMNIINRTVAKFVQMSRFYGGVNSIWNLPLRKLFESNIMAVATIWVRFTGRNLKYSWATVYEIKPNEFSSSPPYHFPKLGVLKFRNPSEDPLWPEGKKIIQDCEDKKMAFWRKNFSSDILRAQEQEAIQKAAPRVNLVEERSNYVIDHLDEFLNENGELSYMKIQAGPINQETGKAEWLLSSGTATRVKGAVEAFMSSSVTKDKNKMSAPSNQ